jgi:alkanesulfonate monooxygenase SsuD/methylene tetrahydromethanopterin reductase-like flavin-dependent oxidoreductase (luciferase family)
VPSFRNPAIMTKMATTMHEMSHGRLILDTGAGWNQPEYQGVRLGPPSITATMFLVSTNN